MCYLRLWQASPIAVNHDTVEIYFVIWQVGLGVKAANIGGSIDKWSIMLHCVSQTCNDDYHRLARES
jgi:hypothetical protein